MLCRHDVVAGRAFVRPVANPRLADRDQLRPAGRGDVLALVGVAAPGGAEPRAGASEAVPAAYGEDLLRDRARGEDLQLVAGAVGNTSAAVDHVGAAVDRSLGDDGLGPLQVTRSVRSPHRAVLSTEYDLGDPVEEGALDLDDGAGGGLVPGDAAADADDVVHLRLRRRPHATRGGAGGKGSPRQEQCRCAARCQGKVEAGMGEHERPLFLEPAGLAVGLALKELRYGLIRFAPGD